MWHKPCKLRPHHTLLTEKPLPTNSLKSEPWMPKANTHSNSMNWRLSISSSSYAHSIYFTKRCFEPSCPERLHTIKEKLCDTAVYPAYRTNLPFTSWNWSIKVCRYCNKISLKPRLFSNELCCENCGLLEPLDGVSFDYNEIYKCGDYKVVKQRRSTLQLQALPGKACEASLKKRAHLVL